jgi:hypothetical protein
MTGRCEHTTDGFSFRFFSPEQLDQILRDGAKQGRKGSHAAIERILKHELGLPRIELWRRIRQLKNPARQPRHYRSVWSVEDEKILHAGYQIGWRGKREAICELLKRHPDWRPHVIWRRAEKLGFVRRPPKRGQERSHVAWSENDDRILLDLAGYKRVPVIAKMLHRSEAAIRYRLTTLGKSSRTHVEGFARSALARDLHLSTNAIQRLIVEGLLEVRDPRITRHSLDSLRQSGRLEAIRQQQTQVQTSQESDGEMALAPPPAGSSKSRDSVDPAAGVRASRAERVWGEVAQSLGITVSIVEGFIAHGILKFYDPVITEKSVERFCRRYGSYIEYDFLNRETREWLQNSMDWKRTAGETATRRLIPLRKHARVVRRCAKCGRSVRGNAFFRHVKGCNSSEPKVQV